MVKSAIMVESDMKAKVLADGRYQCPLCEKTYSSKLSFNAHRYKIHGSVRNTIVCPGPNGSDCGQSFPSMDALAKHVESDHKIAKNEKQLIFDTEEDFSRWLADLENSTNVNFVHNCGTVISSAARYTYYMCQRSGQKKEEVNISGRTVAKGTSKIGACCPAKITVKVDKNNSLQVTANLAHFGHKNDLAFVPLPMAVIEEIEALLLVGLRPEDIPDQLRRTTALKCCLPRIFIGHKTWTIK
jgi:hypothetical protein